MAQIKSRYFLTSEGLNKLKKDYQSLKKIRAFKVKGEFPLPQESEDLNPEYLSLQEDLSLLETKLMEIEDVLKNVQLIKPPLKQDQDKVGLGAQVCLEVDGRKAEFSIVGPLEADPDQGRISTECMVGQAILGRTVGDKVVVRNSPKRTFHIKKIVY